MFRCSVGALVLLVGFGGCSAPSPAPHRVPIPSCQQAESRCIASVGGERVRHFECRISDISYRYLCEGYPTPAADGDDHLASADPCEAEKMRCWALCADAGIALFRCELLDPGRDVTCDCNLLIEQPRRRR